MKKTIISTTIKKLITAVNVEAFPPTGSGSLTLLSMLQKSRLASVNFWNFSLNCSQVQPANGQSSVTSSFIKNCTRYVWVSDSWHLKQIKRKILKPILNKEISWLYSLGILMFLIQ